MSKLINYVLSFGGLAVSVLPIVFRNEMGRILDDFIYFQYNDDVCLYLAADHRYARIVITSLILFAIIFLISLVLIKLSNRRKPRLMNIVLIAICVLLNGFASMNIPHHYYRLNPSGYRICE